MVPFRPGEPAETRVPPALREAVQAWIDDDPDPADADELRGLLRAGATAELTARFAAPLTFGTAGVRGPLGAGPARMNRATVRRVVAGLARYLRDRVPDAANRPVVIGWDARRGSAQFAAETAAVLSGAGLRPVRLPDPVPTPVLAFAVRHLGAVAGVMVTASHNPPGDNGCKVYSADGAQIVAPMDSGIAAAADRVGPLRDVPLGGPGELAGPEVLDAYLDAVVAASLHTRDRDVRIGYTPLHGVGLRVVREAFRRAGFPEPAVVSAQAEPDGAFPTVAAPNPEEPGTLDLLIAESTATGADLLIANDPDADRLAAVIPTGTGWRVLHGDEIGALLAWHLLTHPPAAPNRLVVTTVVSASLLGRMAAAAGVRYAETLTGFKWIMRAADRRPGSAFLFGYEEALGYAVSDVVRDKDGISAALALAEVAAEAKRNGRSLSDLLDELARRFGLHATAQWSAGTGGETDRDGGIDGAAVLDALRSAPPATLLGRPVTAVDDLGLGVRFHPDGATERLDLPRSDVLVWRCADETRVAVRPSGTEPKLKIYGQVVLPARDRGDLTPVRAAAADQLAALHGEVTRMLGAARAPLTRGIPMTADEHATGGFAPPPDSVGPSAPPPGRSARLTRDELAAMIDHTLLSPQATSGEVAAFCREAAELGIYAVCVSPTMVTTAVSELAGTRVAVASVTGFPSGAHQAAVKAAEAARAVSDGASEVDMVINLGLARAARWDEVGEEIAVVRAAAPRPAVLKVIIEAAVLDPDGIVAACRAAESAGADYVKTSTGFHSAGGATTTAVAMMAGAVRPRLGVKAAGGIRSAADALAMVQAGATRLGMSRSAAVLAELAGGPAARTAQR